MKKKSFVIIAGGTGGHVYPAISLAKKLSDRRYPVVFLTDKRGAKFIKLKSKIKIFILPSPRKKAGILSLLEKLYVLIRNFCTSLKKLKTLKPSAVIGFGGYYSISPILASYVSKIPILIHEQNAMAGRANKLLFPIADRIAISFRKVDGLRANKRKIVRTGTPIRPEFFKLGKKLYSDYSRKTNLKILVIGGSQGAQSFSKILPHALSLIDEKDRKRLVISQQCNKKDIYQLKKIYAHLKVKTNLKIFFHNLPKILTKCHLVIARSGASTIAELEVANKPSILIPYPYAKDNHQMKNAQMIESAKPNWILEENEKTPILMSKLIQKLIKNPGTFLNKVKNKRKRTFNNGSENLAKHCVQIVGDKA